MGSGDGRGQALRILHVEDSEDDSQLVQRALRRDARAVHVVRVETADQMRAALAGGAFDVVLSDWTLPMFSGLEALAVLGASGHDLPFLIVSGSVGEEQAVAALRAGAHDYVLKDRMSRLGAAIDRELREAEKRSAGRALAGGIAHDFNNILSVILSLSQMTLGDSELAPHLHDDIDQIRVAAGRAADLTKQLFAFSRQEVIEPTLIDLGALVRELDRMLRHLAGTRSELVVTCSPSLGRVRAERSQLEQVVVNLVVNARDAMRERGGKLAIDLAEVVLDETFARAHPAITPGGHVRLVVSDSGCGIPADTLPRIFEPFFTTKGPASGTGLGLSTVDKIVHDLHGAILVDSELGRGTSFAVYLPRAITPLAA